MLHIAIPFNRAAISAPDLSRLVCHGAVGKLSHGKYALAPSEHLLMSIAIYGDIVALGHRSDRVSVLKFGFLSFTKASLNLSARLRCG